MSGLFPFPHQHRESRELHQYFQGPNPMMDNFYRQEQMSSMLQLQQMMMQYNYYNAMQRAYGPTVTVAQEQEGTGAAMEARRKRFSATNRRRAAALSGPGGQQELQKKIAGAQNHLSQFGRRDEDPEPPPSRRPRGRSETFIPPRVRNPEYEQQFQAPYVLAQPSYSSVQYRGSALPVSPLPDIGSAFMRSAGPAERQQISKKTNAAAKKQSEERLRKSLPPPAEPQRKTAASRYPNIRYGAMTGEEMSRKIGAGSPEAKKREDDYKKQLEEAQNKKAHGPIEILTNIPRVAGSIDVPMDYLHRTQYVRIDLDPGFALSNRGTGSPSAPPAGEQATIHWDTDVNRIRTWGVNTRARMERAGVRIRRLPNGMARVEFAHPGTYTVNGRPIVIRDGETAEQTAESLRKRDTAGRPIHTLTLRIPNVTTLIDNRTIGISTTVPNVERRDSPGIRQDTNWSFHLNLADLTPGQAHRMNELTLERTATEGEYRVNLYRPGGYYVYGRDPRGQILVLEQIRVHADGRTERIVDVQAPRKIDEEESKRNEEEQKNKKMDDNLKRQAEQKEKSATAFSALVRSTWRNHPEYDHRMIITVDGRRVRMRHLGETRELDYSGQTDAEAQKVLVEQMLKFRNDAFDIFCPRVEKIVNTIRELPTGTPGALPTGIRISTIFGLVYMRCSAEGQRDTGDHVDFSPDNLDRLPDLIRQLAGKLSKDMQERVNAARAERRRLIELAIMPISLPAGMTMTLGHNTVNLRFNGQSADVPLTMERAAEIATTFLRAVLALQARVDAPAEGTDVWRAQIRFILDAKLRFIRHFAARGYNDVDRFTFPKIIVELLDGGSASTTPTEMGINRCLALLPGYTPTFPLTFCAWDPSRRFRLDVPARRIRFEEIAMAGRDHVNRDIWSWLENVDISDTRSIWFSMGRHAQLDQLSGQGNAACRFERLESPRNGVALYCFHVRMGSEDTTWYLMSFQTHAEALGQNEQPRCEIVRARPDGTPDFLSRVDFNRSSVFDCRFVPASEEDRKRGFTAEVISTISFQEHWKENILRACRFSTECQANEDVDQAGMRTFDLPRNGTRIGYMPLHQGDLTDTAMADSVGYFSNFYRVMNQSGYTMVTPRGTRIENGRPQDMRILVDRSPTAIIREYIQDFVKQGVEHIYMDIAAHGSTSLAFRQADGTWTYMTWSELMTVFRTYPSVHFTVNTGACYGAWQDAHADFARILTDVPDAPEGRVTIITHTKSHRLNEGSNRFGQYLTYFIAQGLPFGQAYQQADRYYRIHAGRNPEVHRSSPRGGRGPTYNARYDMDGSPDVNT